MEVNEIEWTSENQIDRLTNIQSSYFNLDPFSVLQVDATAEPFDVETVKKNYRQLSRLVHPDRNQGSARSKRAFEVLNEAYKTLSEDESREFALQLVSDAREDFKEELSRRREELVVKSRGHEKQLPEDDDAETYARGLRRHITSIFIEYEKQRQHRMALDAAADRRQKEAAEEARKLAEVESSAAKSWEDRRGERVASWHTFGERAKASASRKRQKNDFDDLLKSSSKSTQSHNLSSSTSIQKKSKSNP